MRNTRAVNPKLIIVHCSGYGKFGDPDRVKRPAYDGTVGPYAGFTCQNGTPEQPMITMPYSGDDINSYLLDRSFAGRSAQGRSHWSGREASTGQCMRASCT